MVAAATHVPSFAVAISVAIYGASTIKNNVFAILLLFGQIRGLRVTNKVFAYIPLKHRVPQGGVEGHVEITGDGQREVFGVREHDV